MRSQVRAREPVLGYGSVRFGGVEIRVRREKAVEGRAGRASIALSEFGHGEPEHRAGFHLMPVSALL
jgi:hypothetical protein